MITYKLKDNSCINESYYNSVIPSHNLPDWRVDQYIDGVWEKDFEGSWSKDSASKAMTYLIASNHCEFYQI